MAHEFTFYPGLHQPSDAHHFERCCIHIGRLATRRKPLGCKELLLDSQAFRVLELHGEHQLLPEQYAALAAYCATLCDEVTPVTQDYMCEQYIFDRRELLTGVRYTVADHQRLTIERYDAIRAALDKAIYLMPVLQGYTPLEYASHLAQYGARLTRGMWVGVGSVCKRNTDPSAIRDVLYVIKRARPDLRLHGFGIKQTSVAHPVVRAYLHSADSMAWSFAARKQGRNANDWREAAQFERAIDGDDVSDLPLFRRVA